MWISRWGGGTAAKRHAGPGWRGPSSPSLLPYADAAPLRHRGRTHSSYIPFAHEEVQVEARIGSHSFRRLAVRAAGTTALHRVFHWHPSHVGVCRCYATTSNGGAGQSDGSASPPSHCADADAGSSTWRGTDESNREEANTLWVDEVDAMPSIGEANDGEVAAGRAFRTALPWATPPRAGDDSRSTDVQPLFAEAAPNAPQSDVFALMQDTHFPSSEVAELPAQALSNGLDSGALFTSREAAAIDGGDGCPWDEHGVATLVRRRVARWFVPGFDDTTHPTATSTTATSPRTTAAPVSQGKTCATAVMVKEGALKDVLSIDSERTAGAGAGDATLMGTASASPRASTASASSPAGNGAAKVHLGPTSKNDTAAAAPSASSSTAPLLKGAVNTAAAVPSVVEADSRGNKGDAADAADAASEELPRTLAAAQMDFTKQLKRMIMAAMGPDFAKAGLSNDGVRTSFSVVNYQTIKQLTGLKRVPAKLLISCLVAPDSRFDWIDISMHPTATLTEYRGSLQEVLRDLGVPRAMVEDSGSPMLLPQVTVARGCHSLLLRYAIEALPHMQMDSFQDLTNRFTIFITPKRIITVHRTQCSYVEELKMHWQHYLAGDSDGAPRLTGARSQRIADLQRFTSGSNHYAHHGDGLNNGESGGATGAERSDVSAGEGRGMQYLLYYFVKETIGTFTEAIARCIIEFDKYEANLFHPQRNRSAMARDIYHIKRRASVYGRTLTLTQDAYAHIASSMHISSARVEYQEIMYDLAHVESLTEELNANSDSVLQLLFQLSSYQVNELMRVLTLFSAFFIPLSFIASVYGMNFEDLPMLHNPHGGAFCAVLMGTVASCIFMWFRSNRFI